MTGYQTFDEISHRHPIGQDLVKQTEFSLPLDNKFFFARNQSLITITSNRKASILLFNQKKHSSNNTTTTLSANMTNEHSLGGTTVVNPAGLKHSLRSATKAKVVEELEEAALIREEEKIMVVHDEEITSEEDVGSESTDIHGKMERAMLTVALVSSVVEENRKRSHSEADDSSDPSKHRYGLRRRRRAAGEDLKRLEHFQSSTEGGLARTVKRVESHDEASVDEGHQVEADGADMMSALEEPDPGVDQAGVTVEAGKTSGDESSQDHACVTVAVSASPASPPASAPVAPSSIAVRGTIAAPVAPPPVPAPTRKASDASLPPVPTGSVPNPLNRPIRPTSILVSNSKAKKESSSTLQPAPLPVTVPCPLPATSFEEKFVAAPEPEDKRKVTINELVRSRGFSIDMDSIGLDMHDDSSAAQGMPLSGGSRDRAFSFECFAFGINADEPLPPLEQSTSSSHVAEVESFTGRPRGDSIIFDPVSFQDGGIHEQTALERTPTVDMPDAAPSKSNKHPGDPRVSAPVMVAKPPARVVSARVAMPVMVPIVTTRVHAPAPMLSTSMATSSGSTSTGPFSLDLLNKDGRIGIYLPDARRARIIRFHAKRAKRIWRKRIKYDCRKKLADSRPRIKGRFVKRSDMDEE